MPRWTPGVLEMVKTLNRRRRMRWKPPSIRKHECHKNCLAVHLNCRQWSNISWSCKRRKTGETAADIQKSLSSHLYSLSFVQICFNVVSYIKDYNFEVSVPSMRTIKIILDGLEQLVWQKHDIVFGCCTTDYPPPPPLPLKCTLCSRCLPLSSETVASHFVQPVASLSTSPASNTSSLPVEYFDLESSAGHRKSKVDWSISDPRLVTKRQFSPQQQGWQGGAYLWQHDCSLAD